MGRTVLLTGASGVVGQALLKQLADVDLICLTRERSLGDGAFRTVAGDIRRPQLGLASGCYQALASEVDWVIHAAAVTDFTQPAATLHETNVGGAGNMLAFAQAAKAPLLHVSTAFVQPRQGHSFNHYERSKRTAERLLRQSGHPVTIVRPSIVVGDAATGEIGKQQGIHRVMRLLLDGNLPVVPGVSDARIDFVPRDYVAAAIVGLLRRGVTDGDYWLTAGEDALTLADGLSILAQRGSQLLQREVRIPQLVAQERFVHIVEDSRSTVALQVRERVQQSMALFRYMTMRETLTSSYRQLRREFDLPVLPDAGTTFQRNVEYLIGYAN